MVVAFFQLPTCFEIKINNFFQIIFQFFLLHCTVVLLVKWQLLNLGFRALGNVLIVPQDTRALRVEVRLEVSNHPLPVVHRAIQYFIAPVAIKFLLVKHLKVVITLPILRAVVILLRHKARVQQAVIVLELARKFCAPQENLDLLINYGKIRNAKGVALPVTIVPRVRRTNLKKLVPPTLQI